jgi:hypothetical protein
MPRTVAIALVASGLTMLAVGAVFYMRGSAIGIPLVVVGLADFAIAGFFLWKGSAK